MQAEGKDFENLVGSKSDEDVSDYTKKLEAYKKKLKGYEILSIMFNESLEHSKSQKAHIKYLEEQLDHMAKQLEKSKIKSTEPITKIAQDRLTSSLGDDATSYDKEQEVDNSTSESETGKDELDPGGAMRLLQEFSSRKLEDISMSRSRLSKSSSNSSFVKVTDSQVGEEDVLWSDPEIQDDDDDLVATCGRISDKVATMVEVSEETPPMNPSLEADLKAMMSKLKVIDSSKETPECQSSKFIEDVFQLTEKMLRFYGRSQAIQALLEKYEQENKELKSCLDTIEGKSHPKVDNQPSTKETLEVQQEIENLLSCKQALLNLMSTKDQQLIQYKNKIRSLKVNLDKMRLSQNRATTCLQENTKKWQREYNKLEEQLKHCQEQRECERQEACFLRSEIRHLKRRLEELKQLGTTKDDRHDTNEIEILKQQIAVYAEDFNNERRDREKTQASVETLQKKLEQLSQDYSDMCLEKEKLLEKYRRTTALQKSSSSPVRTYRVSDPYRVREPPRHSDAWQCRTCTYINECWVPRCAACSCTRLF